MGGGKGGTRAAAQFKLEKSLEVLERQDPEPAHLRPDKGKVGKRSSSIRGQNQGTDQVTVQE